VRGRFVPLPEAGSIGVDEHQEHRFPNFLTLSPDGEERMFFRCSLDIVKLGNSNVPLISGLHQCDDSEVSDHGMHLVEAESSVRRLVNALKPSRTLPEMRFLLTARKWRSARQSRRGPTDELFSKGKLVPLLISMGRRRRRKAWSWRSRPTGSRRWRRVWSGELSGETRIERGVVAWRERRGGAGGDIFLGHSDAAMKNGCRLWIIGWSS
jgi:hypothetical protein